MQGRVLMSRNKWEPGNVYSIPLEDGEFAFGIVIKDPLMAFFDCKLNNIPPLEYFKRSKILFKIWVMKYALTKRTSKWKLIGQIDLTEELSEIPTFYKFDLIDKEFSTYHSEDGIVIENPVTREECFDLECAAVWGPEHVEERLNDYFAGRENITVKMFSAKNRK